MINWVYRELRQQNRFIFLFILNLSLGLTGFLCLDAFKVSLQKIYLEKNKTVINQNIIRLHQHTSANILVELVGLLCRSLVLWN